MIPFQFRDVVVSPCRYRRFRLAGLSTALAWMPFGLHLMRLFPRIRTPVFMLRSHGHFVQAPRLPAHILADRVRQKVAQVGAMRSGNSFEAA